MVPAFPALPTFDINEIPFSRRGSWLNLSPVVALHKSSDTIHLVSHQTGMHAVLAVAPTRNGLSVPADVVADPAELSWTRDGATLARATFSALDTLRLSGRGTDLTLTDAADALTPFTGTYFFQDPRDGAYVFTSYETGRRYRLTLITGELSVTGEEALGVGVRSLTVSGDDGWEVAVEEIDAARPAFADPRTFDDVVTEVAREFTEFSTTLAPWDPELRTISARAAYVLWSATVAPSGFLGRESILMSKHWMDKVWSWDHAFNAVAVAPGSTDFAVDQFLAPFDHQDDAGAMPDSVTHSEVLYNFVKPPIHGWALRLLRARSDRPLSSEELHLIHKRLTAWTRFWLESRVAPGRTLPYYQHGNDSGWDNSTAFDNDRVIEAPDLAAFLLIQLDVLAALTDELGLADSSRWRAEATKLRAALLHDLWDGEAFFARGAHSDIRSKQSSLLTSLPIVAAEQLPESVTSALARKIEQHLTDWGPATQLPNTPEYEGDGYWRGPIWAPSTLLIEDGLRRAGHSQLADRVSESFQRLCENSGFAENFDALTGEGLRDRAYTWTASVYLILKRDQHERASAARQGPPIPAAS